jgi:hypothetical protein
MSTTKTNKIFFDDGAQGFLILFLLCSLFLNNGIYLFIGALCFAGLSIRLQQPMKPSVFTLIFIYHFLQVAAFILLSNYSEQDINFKSPSSGQATIVAYVGMFFLFYPIVYFQNKIPNLTFHQLKAHAGKLSVKRIFTCYIISFFTAGSLTLLASSFGGYAQITYSIINVKWLFFVLFGFKAILNKEMKREFFIVVILEFLLGFFSYFSNFKTVVFFTGFIYLILLQRVYLRQLIVAGGILLLAFFVGVIWTSIKGEYRSFLNTGSNTQVVSVSQNDALIKLAELTDKQNQSSFDASVNNFFERIQYTYHLAKTMDRVPSVIPYQLGKNLGSTIEFVFTPRILNPDKPSYEATSKTSWYTGIIYAGASSGTSFSLGYFADCYIDFGLFGMFIPLLFLGWIYGVTYFYFVRKSSNNFLFNYAVVGAMFMEFLAFEMDSTFLLGRLAATLLTFFMLKTFFFPWLIKYLSAPVLVQASREDSSEALFVSEKNS